MQTLPSMHAPPSMQIEPAPRPRGIDSAFQILAYNQNLVQFADSKANTLILINSIALASSLGLAVVIPHEWRPIATFLRVGFLLASIASVGLSLAVVLSRIDPPPQVRRRDLVFFADILSRPTPLAYRHDFVRTDDPTFLNDLLERNYRLAEIASRKYRYYGVAQQATVCACVMWMAYIVFLQGFV